MVAEVHEFNAEVGGAVRMSLTYVGDEADTTSGSFDTYSATFTKLEPGVEVVEVSQPEMTTTTTLAESHGGTDVVLRQTGIPDSISVMENEAGCLAMLANLAKYVEGTR